MTSHGTLTSYVKNGCRCNQCQPVGATYWRNRRAQMKENGVPPMIHGRNSTYINYSCRCRPCKDAHNQYHREYRKRQKQ